MIIKQNNTMAASCLSLNEGTEAPEGPSVINKCSEYSQFTGKKTSENTTLSLKDRFRNLLRSRLKYKNAKTTGTSK